jgi:5-methylcytosine-specific restriction endonuclease McrA
MKRYSYTEHDVRDAVASSRSYAEVLRKLGVRPAGGNYDTIKRLVRRLELDTSHFTGRAHRRGRTYGPRKSLQELLRSGSTIQSYKLKRRLLDEGLFERVCMRCKRTHWEGQPIPLELHHKDGDRHNNLLTNLEILCPNCHALTDTYRGKNIGQQS